MNHEMYQFPHTSSKSYSSNTKSFEYTVMWNLFSTEYCGSGLVVWNVEMQALWNLDLRFPPFPVVSLKAITKMRPEYFDAGLQ